MRRSISSRSILTMWVISMAYSFNRLFSAMGQNPEQKSDIFGQQAGSQGPQGNEAQNGLSLTGGSEAIGSGSSSSSGSGAQPVRDTAVSSPSGAANQSQIFSQNQQATPGFVGNVKQGVDTAKSALDKEVESYTAQKPPEETVDYRALASSISRPKNAMAGKFAADQAKRKLQESINAKAPESKEFESAVDTSFTDVDRLGSVSGLADLYQKGSAGGEYSSKLAKFDAAKLSGEKDFQNTKKAIQEGAAGVRQRQEDLAGPGQSDIEKNQKALFENAQAQKMSAIRDALVGAQGDIQSDLKSAAERQNAVKVSPDMAAYHKKAMEEVLAENPDFAGTLSSQLNPYEMQRFWSDPAALSAADVTTEADVGRFSNINDLLAQAGGDPRGELSVGGGRGAGAFDMEGYKKGLRSMAQASANSTKSGQAKKAAEDSKKDKKKATEKASGEDLPGERQDLPGASVAGKLARGTQKTLRRWGI